MFPATHPLPNATTMVAAINGAEEGSWEGGCLGGEHMGWVSWEGATTTTTTAAINGAEEGSWGGDGEVSGVSTWGVSRGRVPQPQPPLLLRMRLLPPQPLLLLLLLRVETHYWYYS